MTFSEVALVLLTAGTITIAPPLFAHGDAKHPQSTQGQQSERSGVSSNTTRHRMCFSRDESGRETEIVCPNSNPADNQ